MSITLLVTLVAKPASIGEIAQVMTEVKDYLPKIDGCESVRIVRDLDEPARFSLIESWSSRGHHETYQRSIAESGGWGHILEHLASEPVSTYYEDF
jgi:quinol monooxygenase YgiN